MNLKKTLLDAAKTPALCGINTSCVSIAYLRTPCRYAWLTITWSMPETEVEAAEINQLPGVTATFAARPADTVIAIPAELASPAELEEAILQAAYELGAWDVCRMESPPLPDGADWQEPRYGVAGAFGRAPQLNILGGLLLQTGDAATDGVCEQAAREGYTSWRFVPLALSEPFRRARWGGLDTTLAPDCTRSGVQPFKLAKFWHPNTPGYGHEHQYQFGRQPRRAKS